MILQEIVAWKREELKARKEKKKLLDLKARLSCAPPARNFVQAIKRKGNLASLIAEIKKASPSRGVFCSSFSPQKVACAYERAGARAISVITEQKYFLGNPDYLQQVRAVSSLPLLCKDFIIDPYQIYEARLWGADAVLLITAVLSRGELVDFLGLVSETGMSALVEVHTSHELSVALEAGAEIIGINNRDLNTFQTDLNVTSALAPLVPKEKVVVSESGVRTFEDIRNLSDFGVDAVLVGEALMCAPDPEGAVRRLLGKDINDGLPGIEREIGLLGVEAGAEG